MSDRLFFEMLAAIHDHCVVCAFAVETVLLQRGRKLAFKG